MTENLIISENHYNFKMLNIKSLQTRIAMITNDKVTEFFRIVEDFYKVFDAQIEKHTIKAIQNAEGLLGKCTGISVVYGTPFRVCYLS